MNLQKSICQEIVSFFRPFFSFECPSNKISHHQMWSAFVYISFCLHSASINQKFAFSSIASFSYQIHIKFISRFLSLSVFYWKSAFGLLKRRWNQKNCRFWSKAVLNKNCYRKHLVLSRSKRASDLSFSEEIQFDRSNKFTDLVKPIKPIKRFPFHSWIHATGRPLELLKLELWKLEVVGKREKKMLEEDLCWTKRTGSKWRRRC